MALGDALQENKVLRTLNVANNSIDSVACLTICAGVLENEVCLVILYQIIYHIMSCQIICFCCPYSLFCYASFARLLFVRCFFPVVA
jgi:hypothetical protein